MTSSEHILRELGSVNYQRISYCIGLLKACFFISLGNITQLCWQSDSKQLVSAGGSDRSIRVWHNPVGVRASLIDLKEKLPRSKSDAMKVCILLKRFCFRYLKERNFLGEKILRISRILPKS